MSLNSARHVPVLLEEVTRWLEVKPDGLYVDCTVGAGGYAAEIARRLTAGRLIAIDRDPRAIESAGDRLRDLKDRIQYVRSSFAEVGRILDRDFADGIVADLGVSREQLGDAERGFSFLTEGPLDMRMDPDQTLTAAQIVNHYGEKPLADLLYRYGEERRSRRISRAIVRARPLRSTRHLADVIERAAPRTSWERIHPATKTFQALRIVVNEELEELEKLLEAAPPRLKPGGRFVVVTFHSLEDRAVKLAFRRWAERKVLVILTKHVIRPGREEIQGNPASRSAKLRAAERRIE